MLFCFCVYLFNFFYRFSWNYSFWNNILGIGSMDLSDENQFKHKKKKEKLLLIWQSIVVLFRISPYVVTRQLYFPKKYFVLGQHTGEYFYYGQRLTGDKASMTKLIKNRPRLACLTMAPLIVVQACKRSFLFGFQFINKERIMDVTGPVGVKV